jgi:hypothetical protein
MRILIMLVGLLAAGQLESAPPMKMGLWEMTSSTTMTFPPGMVDSMKKMGMASGVPFTNVEKVCITPEQWRKSLGIDLGMKGCTFSKRDITGKTMTLSMTCSFGGGVAMAMDTNATFSSETLEGSAHATTTYPANMMGGGKSVADSTSKGKFISSDCGTVQPGKPMFGSGGK